MLLGMDERMPGAERKQTVRKLTMHPDLYRLLSPGYGREARRSCATTAPAGRASPHRDTHRLKPGGFD